MHEPNYPPEKSQVSKKQSVFQLYENCIIQTSSVERFHSVAHDNRFPILLRSILDP